MSADRDEDPVLAKAPGACCLKGTIHEGESRGRFITVASVETYITEPTRPNGHILLYFPDVWGMFPNGLLIMDGFADAGYLVMGIDYFQGDPVWKHRKNRHNRSNPNFDYEAWKKKHMAFADEHVPRWVIEVKTSFGQPGTKYACVGYCFGAPYVCNELAGETVTAGAFAHPAFLKEHHFLNLKSGLISIFPEKPLFLSCTDTDHTFDTASRRRLLDIMQAENKTHQLQLFHGVEHGFALRGDMESTYERYVKMQSLEAIVRWFDFWLGI